MSSLGFIEWNKGYIYGTSFGSHRIYRIDSANQHELVAGSSSGYQDGPGLLARFQSPNGIINSKGGDSLFISEFGTPRIRVITGLDSIGLVSRGSGLFQPSAITLRVLQPRFIEELHCILEMPASGRAQLELRDLQGRILWKGEEFYAAKGESLYKIPVSGIAKGVYLVTVRSGDALRSEKVILR